MMQLDFDQMVEVSRLRDALGQATGKGVNVGVLDTGVDVSHPDLQGVVSRSLDVASRPPQVVCQDLPVERLTAAQLDPVGHGTACAGIIHQLAPEATLVSVRVIGAGATGTGEQLIRGFQAALDLTEPRLHVLNLSLGTLQDRFALSLRQLTDRAYFEGRVLVAAVNNMGQPSYPAQFASLIAVDSQSYPDPLQFEFLLGKPFELAARGIYVKAPKSGGGYCLWTGTSFACPHITGVVARLLSINPRLTPFQVKTLLHLLRSNRQ